MASHRVALIGAGIGGLAAAALLARNGVDVTVLERAPGPGGKMSEETVAGRRIDAGPTVFTMRWVFDELFADLGTSLDAHLTITRADILARHAWGPEERLDLFADPGRSAEAIGRFAGVDEARGFRDFLARARRTYATLEGPFIRGARPTPVSLATSAGLSGLGDLWRISPFTTLWKALGEHFRDPRLRQLFGRYATYIGASPFLAPATLMLVAHVEQEGVWLVEGGMHRVATTLADLAAASGATFRYGAEVAEITVARGRATGLRLPGGEHIEADAVIANTDAAAFAEGLLGGAASAAVPRPAARSLSAVTWAMVAKAEGFPLSRHTVFFSADYEAEFRHMLERGRLPARPTVYVCAQDRDGSEATPGDRSAAPGDRERLLVLVNAPATGDSNAYPPSEVQPCETAAFALMERCGLRLTRQEAVVTTPAQWRRRFPGTGGALYGAPPHGWAASFGRPAARTALPGLYLAGGSVHPGAGVPMATLSGRQAAASVLADLAAR